MADLTQQVSELRLLSEVAEAEVYTSLDAPERVVVVQLWTDQQAYGTYWLSGDRDDKKDPLRRCAAEGDQDRTGSEFYLHQQFRKDGMWLAESLHGSTPAISWPGRGAVRVFAQGALPDPVAARPALLANSVAALREPGCLQFEWFQGTEFAQDCLLLELWSDQQHYDRHWRLRMQTGSSPASGPVADRGTGSSGMEFYRHEPFVHLYDRWLPADPNQWSDTVAWPS
ncbi:putative quinol monooxygenase [Streptomyces sp. NPDC090106]|uniref:putative quinol monooxygenase n=1 Tax=Streptomyces sp. NPDC090106 TaxID=3365946 RepID=UPI00382CC914